MAESAKPVEVNETVKAVNADAEKDVQNVLAELKSDKTDKPTEADAEAPAATETPVATQNPVPTETPAATEIPAADADAEEARIVAAASKLGQDAEKNDGSKEEPKEKARNGDFKGKKNFRDNIKSDLTGQAESSDPVEIRKQVEFYFSDSNLPMDKFLLSKVGGSANNSVPLSIIHSFKRMRHFQPFSAIVEALKSSEVLELTDNDTAVKRKVPLEDIKDSSDPSVIKTFEDKAMSRSIYAKGFGKEEPTTQFDIEAFFAPYGPTNAIRLRRAYDKTFKGSVFVEFDAEETQQKFLALDPKPKWKGTEELLIKSKKEYCEEKVKEIEAGRIKPNRGRGDHRGRGRGGRSNDQRKGFNARGRGRGGNRGRGNDRNGGPRQDVQKDTRGVPVIQVSAGNGTQAGQKRSRDEGNEDRPAKKVDAKEP